MAKKIRITTSDLEQSENKKEFSNSGIRNKFKKSKTLKKRKNNLYIVLAIIILTLILILFPHIFKPSLEAIKDSVVKVEIYNSSGELISTGSGFCAYDSNYIITNFHVIDGAYSIKIVTDDNKKHNITDVLIFDAENDLAILKSNVSLKPLKIGSSKKLSSGNKITTIGSPLGELNTASTGIISNADNSKGIQISASIAHGSSGGVLLDSNYNVIGITYASLNDGNSLNYAISIDYLKKMKKAYDDKKYFSISNYNYESCISSFLLSEIIDSSGFISCDNNSDYYSTKNIDLLYKIGNPESVYEHNIRKSSWSTIYNSLSFEDKAKVVSYYISLLNTDFCEYNCNISSNINSWNVSEFFVNLSILDKYELALVKTDIDNYSGMNSQHNRVETYPLSAAQKSLILYLIGKKGWNNIHTSNKKDIFDFFDEKGYSTKDFGSILKMLGYTVKYNSDGTLTAYW